MTPPRPGPNTRASEEERRERHALQSNAFVQEEFLRRRGLSPSTIHPAFLQTGIRNVDTPIHRMAGERDPATPFAGIEDFLPREEKGKPQKKRLLQKLGLRDGRSADQASGAAASTTTCTATGASGVRRSRSRAGFLSRRAAGENQPPNTILRTDYVSVTTSARRDDVVQENAAPPGGKGTKKLPSWLRGGSATVKKSTQVAKDNFARARAHSRSHRVGSAKGAASPPPPPPPKDAPRGGNPPGDSPPRSVSSAYSRSTGGRSYAVFRRNGQEDTPISGRKPEVLETPTHGSRVYASSAVTSGNISTMYRDFATEQSSHDFSVPDTWTSQSLFSSAHGDQNDGEIAEEEQADIPASESSDIESLNSELFANLPDLPRPVYKHASAVPLPLRVSSANRQKADQVSAVSDTAQAEASSDFETDTQPALPSPTHEVANDPEVSPQPITSIHHPFSNRSFSVRSSPGGRPVIIGNTLLLPRTSSRQVNIGTEETSSESTHISTSGTSEGELVPDSRLDSREMSKKEMKKPARTAMTNMASSTDTHTDPAPE